ncbi:predicted protein [Histoplasma mississippiense (nom. inval.)]|uniref:predicted protein n=1 Tax=Ajellomyces capsulatus (strain NAm1 / WU24) TaxID=2059318 RepID=UPI000157C7DF|nr:predicted protein [Histoplasma mississippiense (nom. inval.)]EDN09366.1 predicted protein [Histoplasma mississippiense (nom. inval.)]
MLAIPAKTCIDFYASGRKSLPVVCSYGLRKQIVSADEGSCSFPSLPWQTKKNSAFSIFFSALATFLMIALAEVQGNRASQGLSSLVW